MSTLAAEAAAVQFGGKNPWPNDVKLYQPYEVEQILPAELSGCLAVRVFLKMCDLPYEVILRKNAEFMSPSGKVPFINASPMIVSEFDPIVSFVKCKGHDLNAHLDDVEKADMKAFMSLAQNVLLNAELWVSWCDSEVCSKITCQRYGSPFCWPLNRILPYMKQQQYRSILTHRGWADKTYLDVCEEVKRCCQALSEKLGEQDYFFGSKPCDLDALVFGHLYTLLSTQLPKNDLAITVVSFPNLSHFCTRINDTFLKEIEIERLP